MKEPWNLKQDDIRVEDTLPIFIIFCEDAVSEPIYFKFFETSKIKVNTIEAQKSKMENVFNAIKHCLDEDLMEIISEQGVLKKGDTQVWCVFDRDFEEAIDQRQLGGISFNEAIATASARGINVAWSNDSFELWVLLHFENVDSQDDSYKNRITYYERLTEIFKALPNPNEFLTSALEYAGFNYKASLKSRKNFLFIVREAMLSNTISAINRAELLELKYSGSDIGANEQAPCTKVHYLVKELLRLGDKKIPVTNQIE